ncbi:MAG: hypothetical protein PHG27_05860 [Massilibacteroides sp.]|nr:hypothetical protein [Massilibacteroides sp.]MDD3062991.1 hypothetical protein [Massilibacteroides sp.]MDD4115110.1 hypothetical protein [Massilibacteroides sp.]MDD4660982.1 hypothetical protein [Massilibacteroides sp.]
MKWNEQETDRLTRSLMKETLEKPSTGLNNRVMSFILKNRRYRCVSYIKKPVSAGQFFLFFVVYMLVIAGGLLSLRGHQENMSEQMVFLKNMFPLFLTIAGGISFFIFFGLLDEWLRQKHRHAHEK